MLLKITSTDNFNNTKFMICLSKQQTTFVTSHLTKFKIAFFMLRSTFMILELELVVLVKVNWRGRPGVRQGIGGIDWSGNQFSPKKLMVWEISLLGWWNKLAGLLKESTGNRILLCVMVTNHGYGRVFENLLLGLTGVPQRNSLHNSQPSMTIEYEIQQWSR